jgi:hypothetical protein
MDTSEIIVPQSEISTQTSNHLCIISKNGVGDVTITKVNLSTKEKSIHHFSGIREYICVAMVFGFATDSTEIVSETVDTNSSVFAYEIKRDWIEWCESYVGMLSFKSMIVKLTLEEFHNIKSIFDLYKKIKSLGFCIDDAFYCAFKNPIMSDQPALWDGSDATEHTATLTKHFENMIAWRDSEKGEFKSVAQLFSCFDDEEKKQLTKSLLLHEAIVDNHFVLKFMADFFGVEPEAPISQEYLIMLYNGDLFEDHPVARASIDTMIDLFNSVSYRVTRCYNEKGRPESYAALESLRSKISTWIARSIA